MTRITRTQTIKMMLGDKCSLCKRNNFAHSVGNPFPANFKLGKGCIDRLECAVDYLKRDKNNGDYYAYKALRSCPCTYGKRRNSAMEKRLKDFISLLADNYLDRLRDPPWPRSQK